MKKHKYVFVLGAPRSGTTLVYGMLVRGQDKIGGTIRESQFYSGIGNKIYNIKHYVNDPYFNDLLQKQEIEEVFAGSNSPSEMFRNVIDYYLEKYNKQIFAEKSPAHTFFFERIKKDFEEPVIIIIERDPCAVINSMVKTDWITLLSDKLADKIGRIKLLDYMSAWMKYYNYEEELRVIKRYDKSFVLKYEDIVSGRIEIRSFFEEILGANLDNIIIPRPFSKDVDHRRKEYDITRIESYEKDMDRYAIYSTRLLFAPIGRVQRLLSQAVRLLVFAPGRAIRKII